MIDEDRETFTLTTLSILEAKDGNSFQVLLRVADIPTYDEAKIIMRSIRDFLDSHTKPGTLQ